MGKVALSLLYALVSFLILIWLACPVHTYPSISSFISSSTLFFWSFHFSHKLSIPAPLLSLMSWWWLHTPGLFSLRVIPPFWVCFVFFHFCGSSSCSNYSAFVKNSLLYLGTFSASLIGLTCFICSSSICFHCFPFLPVILFLFNSSLSFMSPACTWHWLHMPGPCFLRETQLPFSPSPFFLLHWHYWLALCSVRTNHYPHHSLHNCIPKCSQHSSWTAWPLKIGPVGCPWMPVTVNLHWVTSQKIKDHCHSTVEAWNHAWFWSFICVCGARLLSSCMQKCPALLGITSMEHDFSKRKLFNLRCVCY